MNKKATRFFFYVLLVLIPLSPIIAYEIFLRISGKYSTYSEMVEGHFDTYYGKTTPSHYHTWDPNQLVKRDYQEFRYEFKANSLGLREKEFTLNKNKNTFRILTIGDSFTEGLGAPNDSVISVQLSRLLNRDSTLNYEVLNAGIAGSDVFFCYQLFKNKLLEFDFDLVLLIVNSSDVNDVILCGGNERFLDDGTTAFKKAPSLLTLYKYSHVCRAIFHTLGYNYLLLSPKQQKQETEIAINKISKCITSFDSLSHANNVKFLTVLHAFPNEYKFGYNTTDDIRKVIPYLDSRDISYIVLHEVMAKYFNSSNINSFSWPIDGHYNGKGYQIMSKCIFEEINRKYPELLPFDEIEENPKGAIDPVGYTSSFAGHN